MFACFRPSRSIGACAAALALAACGAPPPAARPAPSVPEAARPAAAGTAAGLVVAHVGGAFVPVAGATVRAGTGGPTAITGPDGRYALGGLAAGAHELAIAAPGHDPATTRVVLDPFRGVARAHVVLRPAGYDLAQIAGFDATVSGVVTDPRGAALANASVHVVNNSANAGAGSNFFVTTDANGFYTATLPNVAVGPASPGVVQVSAAGTSPGGIRLDNRRFTSGFLTGPALVLSPQLDTFAAPGAPVITGATSVAPGGIAVVTASGLPSRPDEFYVEVTSGGRVYDVLPNGVNTGTVSFQAPFTLPGSTFTVRLVPFGQVAGASPASPAFASQYRQADLDADLTYAAAPALADGTVAAGANAAAFVAGEEALYTVSFANANPATALDLTLAGTVPAGATIAAATVGGAAVAANRITQPDGAGRFAVAGLTIPANGAVTPVAIRFAIPATTAPGTAFQVTAAALTVPAYGLTVTAAPATPAALTVQGLAAAGLTLSKAVVDDATPGDGVGLVRLVLTPAGSGAIGRFTLVDTTMTDQVANAAGGGVGIQASLANATATQPGGTAWTVAQTASAQNADGSVSVAFTLTPPAAFAAGDGPTTPITVVYPVTKGGANLVLGGGGVGFGARVSAVNLVAPYADAANDLPLTTSAADPAQAAGL